MGYEWDFGVVFREFDMLAAGLLNSIKLFGASLCLGLLVGLIAALMRLAKYKPVNIVAATYIEIFRSTPPLVQLFWVYYALPIVIGVELGPFKAVIIAFSLQSGSFFAEVYRGGIISIEREQWEAGKAIGMNYFTLMRRIILPQAIKRMIPPMTNRAIELFKGTTLVAAIGMSDLLYQAMLMSQRYYRPLEVFTVAAAMYFVILFLGSMGARAIENRFSEAN